MPADTVTLSAEYQAVRNAHRHATLMDVFVRLRDHAEARQIVLAMLEEDK